MQRGRTHTVFTWPCGNVGILFCDADAEMDKGAGERELLRKC